MDRRSELGQYFFRFVNVVWNYLAVVVVMDRSISWIDFNLERMIRAFASKRCINVGT